MSETGKIDHGKTSLEVGKRHAADGEPLIMLAITDYTATLTFDGKLLTTTFEMTPFEAKAVGEALLRLAAPPPQTLNGVSYRVGEEAMFRFGDEEMRLASDVLPTYLSAPMGAQFRIEAFTTDPDGVRRITKATLVGAATLRREEIE